MLGFLAIACWGSTAPPAPPFEAAVARIGVLLPGLGTAANGFGVSGWWPRMGWHQALNEINNKTDGVADYLLPRTHLAIAYRDSKCNTQFTLPGALELMNNVFNGAGVDIILGAACSGMSMRAAELAGLFNVPILSPTSSSPLLSAGNTYPTFMRVMSADTERFAALADLLSNLFNYSAVALASSLDDFGSGGSVAFVQAAAAKGLQVTVHVTFVRDSSANSQFGVLRDSRAHVIVVISQSTDASRFMSGAYDAGVGGEGFLWFGPSWSTSMWASSTNPAVGADPDLALRVFKGGFSIYPGEAFGTTAYESYRARQL
jgi:ABC-type branched-subunit amino acid transport system substrate-binding protein